MMCVHVHGMDGTNIYINPQFIDTFWVDAKGGVHVTTVGSCDSIHIKESLVEFDQMLARYNQLGRSMFKNREESAE